MRRPGPPPWPDAAVALGLLGLIAVESRDADRFPGPPALWVSTALLTALPLAWRRRAPLAVLAVSVVAIDVQALVGGLPQSAGFLLASLLGTYSLAAHAPPRHRWAGLALLVVGEPLYLAQDPGTDTLATAAPAFALSAAGYAVGVVVRRRAARAAAVERAALAAAVRAAREAEAAVAAERLRIAHDLHDIVAHGLSVMVVQASTARVALERGDVGVREGLVAVEGAGRDALAEMRRLLQVLQPEGEADHAPSPGLGDLPALVARVRGAGVEVDTDLEPLPGLGAALELTLYRIVQEALTNVVKHVGPTRAHVALSADGAAGEVVLAVRDDGPREAAGTAPPHVVDSGGAGLVGMRQRCAVYGGALAAGPRPGGG